MKPENKSLTAKSRQRKEPASEASILSHSKTVCLISTKGLGSAFLLETVLEQVNEAYPSLRIIKISPNKTPLALRRLRILRLPTLLFFKEGKFAGRLTGLVGKDILEAKIREFFLD